MLLIIFAALLIPTGCDVSGEEMHSIRHYLAWSEHVLGYSLPHASRSALVVQYQRAAGRLYVALPARVSVPGIGVEAVFVGRLRCQRLTGLLSSVTVGNTRWELVYFEQSSEGVAIAFSTVHTRFYPQSVNKSSATGKSSGRPTSRQEPLTTYSNIRFPSAIMSDTADVSSYSPRGDTSSRSR